MSLFWQKFILSLSLCARAHDVQIFGLPRAWRLSVVEASREGSRRCASDVSSVLRSDASGWLTVCACFSCSSASDSANGEQQRFMCQRLAIETTLCALWVILAAPNRHRRKPLSWTTEHTCDKRLENEEHDASTRCNLKRLVWKRVGFIHLNVVKK